MQMNARRIFLCLLLLVGCSFARNTPPKPTSQPDVFLVTIDTLRAEHVHCYGYDRVQTRALNALARSGRLRRWHCRPGQTFGNRSGQTGIPVREATLYTTTGTTHAQETRTHRDVSSSPAGTRPNRSGQYCIPDHY